MSEWTDKDHLEVHISTQNVSGIAGADGGTAGNPLPPIFTFIRTTWAAASAASFPPIAGTSPPPKLSSKAGGKPVRMMLEREFRIDGRRLPAFGLRPRENRRQKGRHHHGLAVAILGHWRPGWRRHAADALRFQHSQPAQRTHRHSQQHRPGACLARAQPSAGRHHHHGRDGRSRRQAQHGSARALLKNI